MYEDTEKDEEEWKMIKIEGDKINEESQRQVRGEGKKGKRKRRKKTRKKD
jgi:hypothetical protein